MKNLIIVLMFIITSSCVKLERPYTYKIEYLESDTIAYTNKLLAVEDFPEDAMVYQYINGKYIKIMQIYE